MNHLTGDTDAIEWLGVRYKTVPPPKQSGGAMSIVDSWAPAGKGPPRHIHENEDEALVILSRTCKVRIDGAEITAGPGEGVFIPRGTEYTFKVVGDEPSRHLVILTPGGLEGFFAEMAAGQFRIPDDMPAIGESAARHNLRFTGPPFD